MPLGLDIDQERLTELCRRYHVAKLAEMLGQPSEILTLVRDGSAERESKKYVITNKRFDHDL